MSVVATFLITGTKEISNKKQLTGEGVCFGSLHEAIDHYRGTEKAARVAGASGSCVDCGGCDGCSLRLTTHILRDQEPDQGCKPQALLPQDLLPPEPSVPPCKGSQPPRSAAGTKDQSVQAQEPVGDTSYLDCHQVK